MDLSKEKTVSKLISLLAGGKAGAPIIAEGTWGSFAPMLTAEISKALGRPILYIAPHIDDADNAADDITVFLKRTCRNLPAWEAQPEFADATDEIGTERLKLAMEAEQIDDNAVISASVLALCQPVPLPKSIEQRGLKINIGTVIEPELVIGWLDDNGFERVERVDMPGQFACRGGIIDIYAPITIEKRTQSRPEAVRIEFFGDEIESIRSIDLDNQLSSGDLDNVTVIPPIGHQTIGKTEQFIHLLPKKTIIILEEPANIQETAEVFLSRVDNPQNLYNWEAIYKSISKFTQLHLNRFGAGTGDDIKLPVKSAQQYERKAGPIFDGHKAVLDELVDAALGGTKVYLYCENDAESSRVNEIIREKHKTIPKNFHLPVGFIHRGFIIDSLNTIVISHHEIFGQYAIRRRTRTIQRLTPVDSFLDLQAGDYVVHVSYGIGKFKGIHQITKDEKITEYLTIEYANKTLMYVPVHNIALVHKYIGSGPIRPKLSKIGTKLWDKQKEQVALSVNDLATELLEIQAKRQAMGGIAFDRDSVWQKEFDESFLYQETPDQLTCIDQIKNDMQKAVPMDRLLCGDVGYGKTELAMRAAFKAVENGKQVAVLVPTTILCVQHGKTFTERFADFPIRIDTLNRFKTAKQAKEITELAKNGKVDIVIGTHRLLSADVDFHDLGLVIIDEEQRFGVAHKEKLKKLRANVDILTMTATPIPRTLHLSLLGLRDISSLGTPPMDRRSIVTSVCRFEPELIRKAIYRELNRQGQVFFLHNRVQSIERMTFELKKIAPDARYDFAHGQMTKHQLENVMLKFIAGEIDVLVSTTIIESGLDIPNANTIFVNEADRFGLAEMHQLRGRVGRYKHRAYAYMLLPKARSINPVAAKRLKAIEEYSELGAGFKIALQDLEIRGAGNILGAQQSGHIQAVGYEMYCQLLTKAVKKMKNEPVESDKLAVVDLGITTYIPKSYIPSDRQRMSTYRKIADAGTDKDVSRLRDELCDMFGKIPPEVDMMLDVSQIRIKAGRFGITSIVVAEPDIIFSFEGHTTAGKLFAKAPGLVRIPDPKTVHLRLEKNYFEPKTIMAVLRKLLN